MKNEMNDSEFKNLIQSVDELFPKQIVAENLAQAVRQKVRHRRNILRIAVAACVIITAGVAVSFYATFKPAAVSLQQRIAQLQVQVETLQQQIEQLKSLQQEQTEANKLYAAVSDPIEKFNRQVDDAAFAFLYQGDRLYQEMNLADAAVDMYEQVIKLSPESELAKSALKKISQINPHFPHKQ